MSNVMIVISQFLKKKIKQHSTIKTRNVVEKKSNLPRNHSNLVLHFSTRVRTHQNLSLKIK